MKRNLLKLYRQLPWFRGKLRIGKKLFSSLINRAVPEHFIALDNISYSIPNTLENIGLELMINGVYEQDIVQFLKMEVSNGDTYFDIGANIGSLGLPIVKCKQAINYYGFEASPIVFEYLQRNFQQNHILNYRLLNNVVHRDIDQQMKFYQSELYGKSSLTSTYAKEYIYVDSLSLDSFCNSNQITQIDWIKVDVQGFEIYVFEGMEQLLKGKRVKNIVFEFEAWADEQAGIKPGAAQEKLQEWGYVLYNLQGDLLTEEKKPEGTMIWARPA